MSTADAVSPQTCRVLVVDRDNVRRALLSCALTDRFAQLDFADSVEAGLDRIRELRPHVIVVARDSAPEDIPRRIRALDAGLSGFVLLMDEHISEADLLRGNLEVVGADGALPFPFDADQLGRAIEVLLERSQSRIAPLLAKDVALGGDPDPSRTPTPARDLAAVLDTDSWEALEAKVDALHTRLDDLDYYEVLELARESGGAEIKEAFFQRAMQFHPDRFNLLTDTLLKKKIYEVYKRMLEAFRVLSDPPARKAYDSLLEHGN